MVPPNPIRQREQPSLDASRLLFVVCLFVVVCCLCLLFACFFVRLFVVVGGGDGGGGVVVVVVVFVTVLVLVLVVVAVICILASIVWLLFLLLLLLLLLLSLNHCCLCCLLLAASSSRFPQSCDFPSSGTWQERSQDGHRGLHLAGKVAHRLLTEIFKQQSICCFACFSMALLLFFVVGCCQNISINQMVMTVTVMM